MKKFTVKSSLKGKILNGLLLWKMLKVMGDAYGIDLSNIEKSAKVEHALWYLLSNELR